MTLLRTNNRGNASMRNLKLEKNYAKNADGSCLVTIGDTVVLCTASIDERTPPFLRNTGKGWVTAEYSMLPRATTTRTQRDSQRNSVNGRSQEIQRLIGRSLRSAINLNIIGERQIIIDCDVLQADGGTRAASIVGGFIALFEACSIMRSRRLINSMPITDFVAAISCGILGGDALLDLEYREDSIADVDANFVMNGDGKMIEIQSSAEKAPFTHEEFEQMRILAQKAIANIIAIQKAVLA